MHPFVEALAHHRGGVEAIAHRGGDHGDAAAENTLEAFQAAVDLGYRHLETDVHATADGVLVAFHDATLDRVTDRSGPIASLTIDQVRRARVGAAGRVPTFVELVDAFPDVRLTVDLKSDGAVAPMLDLLARRPTLLSRVCIGSFSDRRVAAVRDRFGRAVCTSAPPREVLALRARSVVVTRTGARRGADLLQVPRRWGLVPIVERRLLAAAAAAGVPVHVWTVNDPAHMAALVEQGVAGIVTDAVGALKGVLEGRGAW